ncbi:MAG: GNAT family N-acetyltransferase [Ruminococcus sp.]|nr:GNAT family N-acetyltransferase [Ruminococcus sp.]
MKLRPYIPEKDFDIIKNWLPDERAHAMWCGSRFSFPIEKENFHAVLKEHAENYGDRPFAAADDNGRITGFFCISINTDTKAAFLRFVVVDPAIRGKGIGRQMIELAVEHALEADNARCVQLCVFAENESAVRCYTSAGFELISKTPQAYEFKGEKFCRCFMEYKKQM